MGDLEDETEAMATLEGTLAITPSEPTTHTRAPTLPTGERIANRYIVEDLLGRGAFGEVYRVRDTQTGRERALKLQRASQQTEEAALTAEFALLASLSHPNLAAVHDFGWVGDDVSFFTQDLVVGTRPDRTEIALGSERGVRLVAQLCRALDYLHARGVLHRDVKASNVLVDLSRDHVTLLDFGVARPFTELHEGMTAGTIAYIAPEAIQGVALDGRADLYSLGVLLYLLATGTRPFRGTPTEVCGQHLHQPPPPMTDVPPPLASVIERLLAKSPADRPANGAEVIDLLARATNVALEAETEETRASYVLSARLVGRERSLETLLNGASDPQAHVLAIVGDPGTGKTRLLRELRQRLQVERLQWLSARAHRAPGASSILHDIARAVLTPAVVRQLPEDDRIALARALPELRRDGERIAIPVDPDRAREQRIACLARALGRRFAHRAGIVSVEDLHWASEQDRSALRTLIAETRELGWVTFVLTSRRAADVEAVGAEVQLDSRELGPIESVQMIESMFGDANLLDGTTLGQALLRQSAPALLVQESLRLAVESGTLQRRDGRWSRREDVPALTLREVVERRLALLSDEARQVGLAIAVLGLPTPAHRISSTCALPPERLALPLGELVRSGIVEDVHDPRGGRLYAMHDRFAERLLTLADDAKRRRAHARAADALRDGDWQALERAAAHLGVAGDPRAGTALEVAADAAERAGRPDRALMSIERPIELEPTLRLQLRRFDLARDSGVDAAGALHSLRSMRPRMTPLDALEIDLRRARFEIDRGEGPAAKSCSERLLEDVRQLRASALEHHVLVLRGETERRFGSVADAMMFYARAADLAAERDDRRVEATACQGAAFAAVYLDQLDDAMAFARRAAQAASTTGDPALISEVWRQLGNIQRERGDMARALESQRRAVKSARMGGSRALESKALNNLALVTERLGDFAEADECLRRAIRLKEMIGAYGSARLSENNLAVILVKLGRLARAREVLESILAQLSDSGHIIEAPAHANLGEIAALEERFDDAVELYGKALASARSRAVPQMITHPLNGLLRVRTMQDPDDPRIDAMLAELARVVAVRDQDLGRLRTTRAIVHHARGRLDVALEDAATAYEERRAVLHSVGFFGSEVDIVWVYALMLARSGKSERASEVAAEAQRILSSLRRPDGSADANPLHRAIMSVEMEAPAGWVWRPR